jgi:hypothetical protein
MTPDEIYQLIQAVDTTLAFDTSVTVRGGFLNFCEQVNRVNTKREALNKPERIKLCVPVAAHVERLFDLAQHYGDQYNVEFINETLSRYQITVPNFTVTDAEHCAELLWQRYNTSDEWYAFKKRRCLECIGLPLNKYSRLAKGTGQQCGTPNDWLIIAQASRGTMLLVMDDLGRADEYNLVERKVSYNDARTALTRILDDLIRQLEQKG